MRLCKNEDEFEVSAEYQKAASLRSERVWYIQSKSTQNNTVNMVRILQVRTDRSKEWGEKYRCLSRRKFY
jgi:hypothetical protein